MNYLFVATGLGLALLGGYSIIRPQKVNDIGAKRRYENAELSDRGRFEQRVQGVIVIVAGLFVLFLGYFLY